MATMNDDHGRAFINNCQVEIDSERGVVYVHHPDGFTMIRIGKLETPLPIPDSPERMLDIIFLGGLSRRHGAI